ncbi:NAD(+)/NADH kinase [Catenulispora sp. NL8]|uniref:NAD(+)/NADH kinase n=1 Tax=Catenulispora pinistramenti TaxID=2705254 RepID=A0ABS5L2C1_9ACTN|nr:NAD(+)/NADH kinase [Catenulispora pinistramenti]MBS2552474.1 NAD(+)/NADH kinase [Catenulispora pinistramenti]
MSFTVGLVVNPVAGVGGRVGLKGSDGAEVQERAFALGAVPQAAERASVALAELRARRPDVSVLTVAGAMGEAAARAAGIVPEVVFAAADPTSAADTIAAARSLAPQVDLLLFAGGDGTARDVLEAVGDALPVLGIPTGVKMHSAVFAVNPRAAGEVAADYSRLRDAEVVDRVDGSPRLFGHLRVPDVPARVQQRKTGSSGVTPDAVSGIAAELGSLVAPGELLILGPGTTTRAVAAVWGADVPVLGVNVLQDTKLLAADVTADQLLKLVAETPAHIALTPIGGQGFLLGRGNQQLSPEVLRAVGLERLHVVATEAKVVALGGRPLLVDTGDDALDRAFPRYVRVGTGWRRTILYPLNHSPSHPLNHPNHPLNERQS